MKHLMTMAILTFCFVGAIAVALWRKNDVVSWVIVGTTGISFLSYLPDAVKASK